MRRLPTMLVVAALCVALPVVAVLATQRRNREAEALAVPFKGITADGTVVSGLFPIRATGVSTAPVVESAERFLATLDEQQRAETMYPMGSEEWRRWNNVHRYDRQGVSRADMTPEQEEIALDVLRTSLSAAGYVKARDIMRLNEVIRDLTGRRDEYGERLYHFTVMGEPSTTEPWGWQLDGHHLIINYFVLGDQVVMTPSFWGSEPTRALTGPYAGTRVFEPEENKGLAMIQALDADQRAVAIVAAELPRQVFTAAFRDNFEMRYEGLRADDMTAAQRALLLEVVQEYVGNLRTPHAEVRMKQVKEHLDTTYFAWMGGTDDDAVFYYRIHSPVILIEFDHQGGIALDTDGPTRNHVHAVVRTPNGNDYGKDLLRQHHERFDHSGGEHHSH